MEYWLGQYFTEQPGSGSQYGPGRFEYIFKARAAKGGADNAEFVFGELRGGARRMVTFRGNYIDIDNCRLERNSGYDTIFVATSPTPVRSNREEKGRDGETEYSLSISYLEKPLETHKNYLTNWNYDLYAAVDAERLAAGNPEVPPRPDWCHTAKDTWLSDDKAVKYRWSKTQPPDQTAEIGGAQKIFRWLLIYPRRKPGVEAYPVPSPVVTERIYYRTRRQAEDNLKTANTHVSPGKTYGYPEGRMHWVVQPQGVEEPGDYFVCVNVYTYADSWDIDLWPA